MATEGVVLTIDGRQVEVAPGTGLVEAAAAAGIEIPVFCYEPRVGPAVGACRMCAVEIEGMPKLQTACSTTAQNGMVVSTAGERARKAQDAVLEFLLINHPLDCPVCDKGGECPLQDLTFRWGPGSSRFIETKRTADKPIPISPLIALDRERCILCYRCTRFSADVAQDGELIPRERGGSTLISTFNGRPYEGPFSGNVIELCPVGALTSTQYRFKGRPWETIDVPTVCGGCSVGCNSYASVREDTVARVIARQNDEVDNGWLCDKGRFAYTSLYSDGRITRPAHNDPNPTPLAFEQVLEELTRRIHHRGEQLVWVLSGRETNEEAYLIASIAEATGSRVVAASAAAGPANGATLTQLETANRILVIGDAEVADVAPLVDLHIRTARRHGAQVFVAGMGGSRLEPQGATLFPVTGGDFESFATGLGSSDAGKALAGDGSTVVVYRDGELSDAAQSALVAALGLDADGSGLLALPGAPNARGLAAVGITAARAEDLGDAKAFVFFTPDGSELWAQPAWRELIDGAAWTAAVSTFEGALSAAADFVIPGTEPLEKDGTLVNLEGRLQRLNQTAAAPHGIRSELTWLAALARRLGVVVPTHAGGIFRTLAGDSRTVGSFPAARYSEIPADGVLGVSGGAPAVAIAPAAQDGLVAFIGPSLFSTADVANATAMEFQRKNVVVLAESDARELGIERGDAVTLTGDGQELHAMATLSPRIQSRSVRVRLGDPGSFGLAGEYVSCTVDKLLQTETVS